MLISDVIRPLDFFCFSVSRRGHDGYDLTARMTRGCGGALEHAPLAREAGAPDSELDAETEGAASFDLQDWQSPPQDEGRDLEPVGLELRLLLGIVSSMSSRTCAAGVAIVAVSMVIGLQ